MTDVTNEADLQACILDATDDYDVTADITMVDDFEPYMIPSYTGTFDGHNYTISDLTIAFDSSYVGLFADIDSGGVAQNIVLSNISYTSSTADRRYMGGICGHILQGLVRFQRACTAGL